MKQKRSKDVSAIAKPSVRKVGTMLGSGALCVLTIGAISVCGFMGQKDTDKAPIASSSETTAAEETTTTTAVSERAESEATYTALDTVTWRKASISEYEIAEVAATKTTTSKQEETESKTETEKEEEAKETEKETTEKTTRSTDLEAVEEKTYYVKSDVNLRAGTSKSEAVIEVIEKGEKVTVTAVTKDGVWYAVRYNDTEGYAMADFFTENKPEYEEEPEKAESTALAKAAEAPAVRVGTVSYTDTEYEMLCYVVQNEVGNCSEASKIAVANVVLNRVKSSQFPNSINDVLTTPGQFDAIYNYYYGYMPPSQNTRDCVARALAGEDNTNGATYYYAPQYCSGAAASWFESMSLCYEVDGQRYFKSW